MKLLVALLTGAVGGAVAATVVRSRRRGAGPAPLAPPGGPGWVAVDVSAAPVDPA